MKWIDANLMDALSDEARGRARRRQNHNLHPALDDPVQRLCIAMEPGTYVRPHRHTQADRWELFLVLRGAVDLLTFDHTGRVAGRATMEAGGGCLGVEIPAATWHTLVALAPGTVVFEVKRGPYEPLNAKDFAPWAPPEGDAAAEDFRAWLGRARPGDAPP